MPSLFATQRETVLAYLIQGGGLSSFEAMTQLYIMDLPKRISELRADGYNISDRWEKTSNGKRYKRYFLEEK